MNHHPLDHNVSLATESKGREEMAFPPRKEIGLDPRATQAPILGGSSQKYCLSQ